MLGKGKIKPTFLSKAALASTHTLSICWVCSAFIWLTIVLVCMKTYVIIPLQRSCNANDAKGYEHIDFLDVDV